MNSTFSKHNFLVTFTICDRTLYKCKHIDYKTCWKGNSTISRFYVLFFCMREHFYRLRSTSGKYFWEIMKHFCVKEWMCRRRVLWNWSDIDTKEYCETVYHEGWRILTNCVYMKAEVSNEKVKGFSKHSRRLRLSGLGRRTKLVVFYLNFPQSFLRSHSLKDFSFYLTFSIS